MRPAPGAITRTKAMGSFMEVGFYETEHETYMVTEDGTVYLMVAVDYPDVVCLLRERLPEDAKPVPLDPNAVEEYLKTLA
jgi:hypothetical protein